jgi:hypothetical protein
LKICLWQIFKFPLSTYNKCSVIPSASATEALAKVASEGSL